MSGWHAALFPTGRSGIQKISVGGWRDDSSGPMQVVSGPDRHERFHSPLHRQPTSFRPRCLSSLAGSMGRPRSTRC